MSDVKWIKVVTDIFDDEKIKIIEAMPKGDSIILIWFKLLVLAGKQNNKGVFKLGDKPYTAEMFATIFNRPVKLVTTAMQAFSELGMIEYIDDTVAVPKWEKHQSVDSCEQAKEKTKERVAKFRERQKELAKCNVTCNEEKSQKTDECNVTCNVTYNRDVTVGNALRNRIRNIDIDKRNTLSNERVQRKCYRGQFDNVELSNEEYLSLQDMFPGDYQPRIDRLSTYLKTSGKSYNSHYAVIISWAKEDAEKEKANNKESSFNNEEFLAVALANSYKSMEKGVTT